MEATQALAKFKEVKEVVLILGDRSKTARIGADLDLK
jgi:hypothetical protein